tara:strand:- start:234 stop:398 length:165 start_codon:yes stop_codon:yes gene_type:complete
LLTQRKLAVKALRRNHDPKRVSQIISGIDEELEKRREIKFFNAAKVIPEVILRN